MCARLVTHDVGWLIYLYVGFKDAVNHITPADNICHWKFQRNLYGSLIAAQEMHVPIHLTVSCFYAVHR